MVAEKDHDLKQLSVKNKDLETKIQKLMGEFSSVRTKAQEMLVEKDNDIKRLKEKTIGGRKSFGKNSQRNLNNSGIDSDDALS